MVLPPQGEGPDVLGEITSASSLQELADMVSNLIGNPITIEARDFRLLAYSTHAAVDQVRLNTILQKRAPEAIARLLDTSGIISRLTTSSKPLRISLQEAGLTDRVAIPIKAGGSLAGVMWVHEVERALNERDFTILQQAARLAALDIVRNRERRRSKQGAIAALVKDLVSGKVALKEQIQERSRELGISLPLPYQVITWSIKRTDEPPTDEDIDDPVLVELGEILKRAALKWRVPVVWSMETRGGILLSGRPDAGWSSSASDDAAANHLYEECQRRGIVTAYGCSRFCHDPLQVPQAHREASACLSVETADGPVVSPGTAGVFQLVPSMAQAYREILGSDPALHRKLVELLEQDSKPGRTFSLVETLLAYLDCSMNTKKAALKLHIHAHALNYRMRRIAELSGLDVTNGSEMLAIHLELRLRRFLESHK